MKDCTCELDTVSTFIKLKKWRYRCVVKITEGRGEYRTGGEDEKEKDKNGRELNTEVASCCCSQVGPHEIIYRSENRCCFI